jgi:hypothetical protein
MKNNHQQRFVTYIIIFLLTCLSIAVIPAIMGNLSQETPEQNHSTPTPITSPSTNPSVSPSVPIESTSVKSDSKSGVQVITLLPWLSGLLHITELAGLALLFWLLKDLTGQHKEKTSDLQKQIAALENSLKDQEMTFQSFNSELATVKRSTSRISDIDRQLSEQQIRSNASHQSYKQPLPQQALSKPVPPTPRSAYPFLDFYRQNLDQFKSQYAPIPVSEVEENLQNRWAGSQQEILLGEDRHGNYWLLTEGNTTYLIPNPKLKINDLNMRTVGGLFDCGSYIPGYRSLNIVRPAIVSSFLGTSNRCWRLEQKGVLEFT